ncbi:hypothetical protein MMC11_004856 [Xylographa trunciseda]|nr:hypothetical protein [Xylographa trunciseda]
MAATAVDLGCKTLIVGAGIFGTSTAYHLSLSDPNPSSITILDRNVFPPPSAANSADPPLGASYDINKIVRADYSTPFYMDLAHEAIDAWSTDPLYKRFYHRTGWIMLDEKDSDLAERIRKNFRECGRPDPTRNMSLAEVRKAWGGVLREAEMKNFGSAYWNPEAGWAEADKAVEAMLSEAVRRGVQYHQGNIVELLLHDDRISGIRGVKLADGRVLEADKVLLATGAWTSRLMTETEDTLKIDEDDRIEQQIKAAGVCVAHYKLNEDEKKVFDKMPVIINGENGDIQPPPPSSFLKFTNGRSFTNTIMTDSKHEISVPPSYSQDVVSQALKSETIDIIERIMPQIQKAGQRVAYWRLCWDSVTPTQYQLITRHPDNRLSNLYLAVGGSFHSWKFLPTIGKYVSNVLSEKSNGNEKDENWAWKDARWSSGGARGAHEKSLPKRELRDLENASRTSRI